jgi:hypothetical protein
VGLFLDRSPEQRWWSIAGSWPVGERPEAGLQPTSSRSVEVDGKPVPIECAAVDGAGKWVVCTATGRHQLGVVVRKSSVGALSKAPAGADLAALAR